MAWKDPSTGGEKVVEVVAEKGEEKGG